METDSPNPPPNADVAVAGEFGCGDPAAGRELYLRFAARVRALARANMARGLVRREDVDDVVQSVFRRFFQAAGSGRYACPSEQELWDILIAITLNRLRSGAAFHRAAKRDVRQTVGPDSLEATPAPGEGGGAEGYLRLVVDETLERMPEELRAVVRMRMIGFEVAEIAERLGRSKRTVERLLQEARVHLHKSLGEGGSP